MDANLAFMGTVVAIDLISKVISSAKVNDLQWRNGMSLTKTGMSVPDFDLVIGLVLAWVPTLLWI